MSKNEVLSLGKASATNGKQKHTSSKIQADTLFTFTTELNHIIPIIKNRMVSPRYCNENIRYLKLHELKNIAYPMKCFCDINIHRLEEHLQWYGYYGLAFSKAWGMEKRIQPIQYINPASNLRKDFSAAFSAALKLDTKNESRAQIKMKNFLIHEMMFYKPYQGRIKNRITQKTNTKCLADECEWRFIPDVTKVGFEQAYFDKNILNAGVLNKLSDSMFGIPEISLCFNYTDLKYIIVKTKEDFNALSEEVRTLKITESEKLQLISKVIIWDISKEDF